jgi:hypothetical protein
LNVIETQMSHLDEELSRVVVVACPEHDESAGINQSHRSPNGNRQMRAVCSVERRMPP